MRSANATALVDEYNASLEDPPKPLPPKKKGGKGGKGGKRSASTAFPSPAVQSSAKKRGRQSGGQVNGSVRKKSKDLPEGSWEDQVTRVSSIIEETSPSTGKNARGKSTSDLLGLLEWTDGQKTQHPLDTLRRKCPQRLLDYYEQHL